jgi:hypothetical protein
MHLITTVQLLLPQEVVAAAVESVSECHDVDSAKAAILPIAKNVINASI